MGCKVTLFFAIRELSFNTLLLLRLTAKDLDPSKPFAIETHIGMFLLQQKPPINFN